MNCHICTKPVESFIDVKTNITYYHCLACEYIFKSPECHQNFRLQKKRYDLHTNNEHDSGYIAYFQRFIDFIAPYISECSNALDFGCGKSSILAKMLEDRGLVCDYYDPIYHPTLNSTKKYNLIVSTEVFEHLPQPKEVFATLVAQLHIGGYLALQTQFHPNDIAAFKKWYYHQDTTHIVFFQLKTFEVLANQYGCNIIATNGKNMIILQKR